MRDSRGFTLIELLIVIVIVAILASIVLTAYRHARVRADEVAAVSAIEAINQAQFAFFQTCGDQRYAPTLTSLGVPVPGGTPFLSPDLTQADQITKAGYVIQMGGTPDMDARETCNGAAAVIGYQVTADPVTPGGTGVRFFGSNADRAIYEDAATFTGNMPETGAPPHGTPIPPS
jgi:prepilin-type N-terminal cleavage/methylation domain-containing protein